MKKIYRDSVNIGVAFGKPDRVFQFDVIGQQALTRPRTLRTRFKRVLRLIARFFYRLLKPILRPVAFRVKHYLTGDLRQEQQRLAAQLKEVLQLSRSLQELILLRSVMAHEHLKVDRIEQYNLSVAQRDAIYCGPNEILIRTRVGYVLCASHDVAVIAGLSEIGGFEPGTGSLIQRFLSSGDVFVDVGAHIGLHTLAAARAMQGKGKILAFEPFESTACLLEKTIALNGFSEIVDIHQSAVSYNTACIKLFLGKESWHHSLFPLETGATTSIIEVPSISLDEAISPEQIVTLIKIDAEGAELQILQGAAATINRCPDIALIVELCPRHIKRAGASITAWFDVFADFGLEYWVINEQTGDLETWALEKLIDCDCINLFFSRQGSNAWMKAGALK